MNTSPHQTEFNIFFTREGILSKVETFSPDRAVHPIHMYPYFDGDGVHLITNQVIPQGVLPYSILTLGCVPATSGAYPKNPRSMFDATTVLFAPMDEDE